MCTAQFDKGPTILFIDFDIRFITVINPHSQVPRNWEIHMEFIMSFIERNKTDAVDFFFQLNTL